MLHTKISVKYGLNPCWTSGGSYQKDNLLSVGHEGQQRWDGDTQEERCARTAPSPQPSPPRGRGGNAASAACPSRPPLPRAREGWGEGAKAGRCARKEHGYVLLFVLGLLAVVATLVLGASVNLRLDTQLLAREKARLQEHYALEGAAQYAALQLGISQAVQALRLDPRDPRLRDWPLWQADGSEHQVDVAGTAVAVQLHNATGLPDANILTEPQWQRLLLLAGVPREEEAKQLASGLLLLREQLRNVRGRTGFASLQELLQWPTLPPAVAYGDPAKGRPGLAELVVVGNGNQRVDLDHTPLPLLKALGSNVTDEHLKILTAWRSAGPVNAQQAQQWLQGTGLTAHSPAAAPSAVLARLQLAGTGPQAPALLALIAGENGSFSVLDRWSASDPPGH